METAGLSMTNIWATRALQQRGVTAYRVDNAPADMLVHVDNVQLKHHGAAQKYRPYLHLLGELRSVTPQSALPYDITTVTFAPGHGETVNAFYEFDDLQLVELAQKGYFQSSFDVPDSISGIEWELGSTVDVLVIGPATTGRPGDNTPIVFLNVHNVADLPIDLARSGYDLVEFFENHTQATHDSGVGTPQPQAVADKVTVNALFDVDEFEGLENATRGEVWDHTEDLEQVGDNTAELDPVSLDAMVAEYEAELEEFEEARALVPGTADYLYQQRVLAGLREDDFDSVDDDIDIANSVPEPKVPAVLLPAAPSAMSTLTPLLVIAEDEDEEEADRGPSLG